MGYKIQQVSVNDSQSMQYQLRRSANYKPNIWSYDFIRSFHTKYKEVEYQGEVEKLKEKVKKVLNETKNNTLEKLKLVDNMRKLGLASHFEKEIKEAIDTLALSISNKHLNIHQQNLHFTALCFRLLRIYGHHVSQDIVFEKIENEMKTSMKDEFKDNDIEGILELYEASNLVFEGESILDEAKELTTIILKSAKGLLGHNNTTISKSVSHALELPSNWRVLWFDVNWHINMYENENDINASLLKLAKLNFNIVQATLQDDLRDISRWWREVGVVEKLSFARNRDVESFICSVGVAFEPSFSSFRRCLTKVIIMILVIDDVYDVYGSLDELQDFTNAIRSWDINAVRHLPECMKICFKALYDVTDEIAHQLHVENRWTQSALPHLKRVWIEFCEALLVEATWYHGGHTPSLQEYLMNAWVSSSGTVLSMHSFFFTMNEDQINNKDGIAKFYEENQDLVKSISYIIRLCNDLGTSVAEQQRGDAASSIICYMRESNVMEEAIARKHIKDIISKTWKIVNGKIYGRFNKLSPETNLFMNANTNMARVVHNLYQYGDGFGVQDSDSNKKQIFSLLVHPLQLDLALGDSYVLNVTS